MIYPKNSWTYAKRDKYPYNPFDKILPFITNKMNTTGLVVIQSGEVIFEYGDTKELSYIASCRKSVLAMLYGKYVEDGTIDLSKTIEELGLNDIQGLLAIEKKATVLDLITTRSGIYHPASNGGDSTDSAPERGSQEPGKYYLYNNWDFNAAGAIFEKLTGLTIFDALEKDLAIPLEMEDFKKEDQKMLGDADKSEHLAYHMWFSTRDMARLGYLMLREGNWNGNQVISKKWIREMLKNSTPREKMNPNSYRDGNLSYGYMWWIYDNPKLGVLLEGAYTASGYFGQYITVIPKLDLVIAHKTKSDYLRWTNNYDELVVLIVESIDALTQFDIEKIEHEEQCTIEQYVGEYQSEISQTDLKISKEDNVLYATSERRGKYQLCLSRKNIYYSNEDSNLLFEFLFDQSDNVKGITVTYNEFMENQVKLDQEAREEIQIE